MVIATKCHDVTSDKSDKSDKLDKSDKSVVTLFLIKPVKSDKFNKSDKIDKSVFHKPHYSYFSTVIPISLLYSGV